MYIVRNILVSTDFSDFSAAAVDYAASFALLSVDEDGALQFREPAEHRPSRHLALGHEHDRRQRRDDADVEPGDMVGQDQRGAGGRPRADLANPHPDQRAEDAVIEMRNGPLQPQIEGEPDQLERQQRQRQREEGR